MKSLMGFIAAAAAVCCHAQTLVGVQLNGTVVRIDPLTGTGAFQGMTGFNPVESVGYLNGKYYAVAIGAPPQLIEVNPTTGAGAATGISLPAGGHSLTHGPSGTLYAIEENAPFDRLLKLQPGGTWTLIGPTGFGDVVALTCTPDGSIYAWDTTAGLLTVNTTTGAATDVNLGIPGSNSILSLAAPSNTLLMGARNQLYSINPATGAVALIGGGGYVDVNGLSMEPTECLAVSWPGNAFKLDYMNGAGAALGPSGFVDTNSMAYWRDRWYTSTSVGGGELFSINPVTGVGTGTGILTGDLRAMAEGPGGNLFGIGAGIPCILKRLDTSTGNWVPIGPTGPFGAIQGMAYDNVSGKFYAWDVTDGLLMIDPATAGTVDVNPGLGAPVAIQCLDFGPDGQLYGCNNILFTLNTPTGVAGPVGGGGFADVRGIGFGKRLFEIPVATFTVGPGSVFSGAPADANTSDNAYWQFRPGAILVAGQTPLVITLRCTVPGMNPSKMRFNLETRGTTANVSEKVEMFNYRTGVYDLVHNATLPTADTKHQFDLTRPGEYCGIGNVAQVRLSYKLNGAALVFPWRVLIDVASWDYMP